MAAEGGGEEKKWQKERKNRRKIEVKTGEESGK